MDRDTFKNPGAKHRAVPFWSLNGKLERGELKRQIAVMKQMGFGGAFIHSRTGLATEYMSDEWMELVRFCTEELTKEGMHAWLYDEDRWPSGTCGGMVTQNPKFRQKLMEMKLMDRDAFSMLDYGQEFLGAFALKLDGEPWGGEHLEGLDPRAGMNLADFRRVWNSLEVPEGWTVAVFLVREMKKSDFYNGYTYLDTLNREATEEFIRETHERYREVMGDKFGTEIVGLFTDEPHRGPLLNGFGIANENALAMLPYTYRLFETYRARWDEDLAEELPLLWFQYRGDDFSRVMWQFTETLEEMFLDNFAKPYQAWCRENKILSTGHILHEDSLACQTTMSGSMMRYYEFMDAPGMDNLSETSSPLYVPKQVSSVAKQFGKDLVLSELYGCTGWKSTFEHYKQIGDWQANFGVNLRCPHLSWYTMKGEAKRDYPASILHQSGWYPQYHAVEDYFARIAFAFDGAKALTKTLVVSPVESAWGLTHYGTYYWAFATRDEIYRTLEKNYADTCAALVAGAVDFDYGDEEIMSRHAEIVTREGRACVRVGEMEYEELILSGMINLRFSTAELLNKFLKAGGRVVFCAGEPDHLDGTPFRLSEMLSGYETCEISELAKRAGRTSASAVRIVAPGQEKNPFLSCLKEKDGDYLLLVSNFDREAGHAAEIRIPGLWNVEKLDLRSGDACGIASGREAGDTVVRHEFAYSEELFLRVTKGAVVPFAAGKSAVAEPAADVLMAFELNEPNMLVLDFAEFEIDGKFAGEDEILKIDREIRSRFGLKFRGGEMVQPWYKEKFFGASFFQKVCDLELKFRFFAEIRPEAISLMLETPERFDIRLNGKPVDLGTSEEGWIDSCFRIVKIDPAFVRIGDNVLSVRCEFRDDLNLESLYLLGNFGVAAGHPSRIVSMPERLSFGDITAQGLPFYSGSVTYRLPAEPGVYDLRSDAFSATCLTSGEKIAAFAPFVLKDVPTEGEGVDSFLPLTAVLTRKNLFGPLHEVPKSLPVCGPDSFLTCGQSFDREYQLIEQGVFGAELIKRK